MSGSDGIRVGPDRSHRAVPGTRPADPGDMNSPPATSGESP